MSSGGDYYGAGGAAGGAGSGVCDDSDSCEIEHYAWYKDVSRDSHWCRSCSMCDLGTVHDLNKHGIKIAWYSDTICDDNEEIYCSTSCWMEFIAHAINFIFKNHTQNECETCQYCKKECSSSMQFDTWIMFTKYIEKLERQIKIARTHQYSEGINDVLDGMDDFEKRDIPWSRDQSYVVTEDELVEYERIIVEMRKVSVAFSDQFYCSSCCHEVEMKNIVSRECNVCNEVRIMEAQRFCTIRGRVACDQINKHDKTCAQLIRTEYEKRVQQIDKERAVSSEERFKLRQAKKEAKRLAKEAKQVVKERAAGGAGGAGAAKPEEDVSLCNACGKECGDDHTCV